MEQGFNQAPDGISYEYFKEIYIKNSSNVVDTLTELWNIKEEKKVISEEKAKWNEIRETCNMFDEEMYKNFYNSTTKNITIPHCNPPVATCDVPEATCDVPDATCDNDITSSE